MSSQGLHTRHPKADRGAADTRLAGDGASGRDVLAEPADPRISTPYWENCVMKTAAFVIAGALFGFIVGCGGAEEDPIEASEDITEGPGGDDSTYFVVTHPDFRKCAYPMCGGWFVQRVNHSKTKCADGSYQKECQVLDLDLSALGISEAQASEVDFAFGQR